jgi:pentatricopeptide repeat protein
MLERSGLMPNAVTYNAAISACEKGEQWQKALALLGGDAAV